MTFFPLKVPEVKALLAPMSSIAWLYFIAFFVLIIWLLLRERPSFRAWTRRQWLTLLLLAAANLLGPLLFVTQLPIANAIPPTGSAEQFLGPQIFLLAAIPWMLASVIFGPFPGMLLASLSGILIATFDSQSPFAGLEMALLAFVLDWSLRQSFSTSLFEWLRKAWFSAVLIAGLALPLIFLDLLVWAGSSFSTSLAFALSRVLDSWLSTAIPILVGAFVLALVARIWPAVFPKVTATTKSPTESSLQSRLFSALTPVALLLFASLFAVTWLIASRSAKESVYTEIQNSLDIASQNLPFLLETGEEEILEIAQDQVLISRNSSQIRNYLQGKIQQLPYFEQLIVLDENLNALGGFPIEDYQGLQPSEDEIAAVGLSAQGLPLQSLTVPPLGNASKGAQLSFVAAIPGSAADPLILVGRSQIDSNPFAQAIMQSLGAYALNGGAGMLIDEAGLIAFHSSGQRLLAPYRHESEEGISEISNELGERIIQGYQPAEGNQWAVAIEVPVITIQQSAMTIAGPQLILFLLLGGLSILVLRVTMRGISGSIEAALRSGETLGNLDMKGFENGDELSQLGSVVQKLRQDLGEARQSSHQHISILEKIVGSEKLSLILEQIAEESLKFGASSSRILLLDEDGAIKEDFGSGRKNKNYRALDAQVIQLMGQQKRILISNPARTPLDFGKQPPAQAVAAFLLDYGRGAKGVIWLAFDAVQKFDPAEIDLYEKLATYAAMAIQSSAKEISSQRDMTQFRKLLEEILDPVLLSSPAGEILFANRAARSMFGGQQDLIGQQLRDIPEVSLLQPEQWTDVRLADGRIFSAKVTEISAENRLEGLGILMRDTTSEKQARALRSEFLTTVSHELQDPIQLLRGYLTMLDMTGGLNKKQSAYMTKIGESVDGIGELVGNLFDLERIESERGLQLKQIAFGNLFEKVKQSVEARAKQKEIAISWELPKAAAHNIFADEILLERAIYNLVDRAVRQSPRGKAVRVKASIENDYIRVQVSDQGAGIAPMDIPHVFERLRENDVKEAEQSGNLSLSIVKAIVERHGGKAWVDSKLGQGSSFYFEIPMENPLNQ